MQAPSECVARRGGVSPDTRLVCVWVRIWVPSPLHLGAISPPSRSQPSAASPPPRPRVRVRVRVRVTVGDRIRVRVRVRAGVGWGKA